MLRLIIWVAAIWFTLVFFTGCSQQQWAALLPDKSNNSAQAKWNNPGPPDPEQVPKAKPPQINAATYYTTGLLLENQQNYTGAIEKYNQTLASDPDHANAANHLGICQIKLGKYDLAEKAFRQAIQISPNQPHYHNNLGFTYLLQNKLPDAEAELRNALALDSHFQRAYTNLALTLAKQGQSDQALECFKKATPVFEAHYNLALALHAQKKWDQAKTQYDLSLKANPEFKAAREGLEQLAKDKAPKVLKVAKLN